LLDHILRGSWLLEESRRKIKARIRRELQRRLRQNLYFTKSLEAIISEKYSGFEDFLSETWAEDLIKSTIYYKVRVVFDRFVPDTTDETNSLALAQATSYAIMDYFNQYTYAEISANMISEIAYTETLTFWSTLISAPLVYFGSWAVKGTEAMMAQASVESVKALLLNGVKKMALSPIMEVFDEIIKDGFREALIENAVSIAGGTDDLGFWLSSLSTSYREVKGALGQLSLGPSTNLKTTISLIHAVSSGDIDTILEIKQRIDQDLKLKQETEKAKLAQMSFWDKMLKTDFLKGLFMVIPSVLFGSFSFVALSGLTKMVTSSIKLSPAAYAKLESSKHNRRKKAAIKAIGGQEANSVNNVFTDRVLGQTKKPAELDSAKADIDEKYKDQQNSEKENPSLVAFLSSINYNPKVVLSKQELTKRFNEIQLSNWIITDLAEDYRLKDKKAEFEKIRKSTRKIDFRQRIDEITKVIKNVIKEKYPSSLRFVDITGIELYDPNFVLVGRMARNRQNFIKEYRGTESYVPRVSENIISTMTAVEVLDYLNEQHYGFDQSESLVMMMMDGATIPDHVILADWLDAKGYNIRDDVIVLPANLVSDGKERFTEENWEKGTPSPYYPLIERLYSEVGYLFERAGLITQPSGKYLSYDDIIYELSDFMYENSMDIPDLRLKNYKNGYDFKPKSYIYFKDLFEFIGKLESSLPEETAKIYVSELKSIFDERAFSVFGGIAKNPFYNDARFISYNTLYVLQKYKIVTSTSLDNLKDDFFLDNYELKNFFKSFDKNLVKAYTPADHPRNKDKKYVPDTLRERIREALDAKQFDLEENELTRARKDLILGEIFSLFDDLDKKTQSYWNWYKLFTTGDKSENYLREKSINTNFLLELVFSNDLLPQLQYKNDLAKLFFGSTGTAPNFNEKFIINDNPTLSTLLTMEFVVSRWSKNDFEALSQQSGWKTEVKVTPQDLKQAKVAIINKINEYIKSRGYIADEFTRYRIDCTQKDILPEFDFVKAMFDFATEIEYIDQLDEKMISKIELSQSSKNIRKLLGIEGVNLLGNLKQGIFFSPKTMESIITPLQLKLQGLASDWSFINPYLQSDLATDYERKLLDLYSNFLSKAGAYANLRGLSLFMPKADGTLNQYDLKKWNDERVKGYGVVFHLCQFLGFDPLFFEPLDKEIFKRGAWLRHHFRDWILRKTSSKVSDTLLTDENKHAAYEHYSEGFIVALMNGIIEAIQQIKDEITPVDLENSLKKYMTKYLSDQGGSTPEGNSVGELVKKVLDVWKQKGDYVFKRRLKILNEIRTNYIDEKGIFRYDIFLEKEYDMNSESRFIKNARDFHILLRNDQISGSARDLYVTQHDFDYMQRIFPASGSTQSRITDWIYIFSTVSSRSFEIDWVNNLDLLSEYNSFYF